MSQYVDCPNCGLKFREGRAIHSHLQSCNRFKPHNLFVERWNSCGQYSIMGEYYGLPASTLSNYMTQLRRSPMWGEQLLPAKRIRADQIIYVTCEQCGNKVGERYMKRHLQSCTPKLEIPKDAPRCDCTILLKTKDELAKGKCIFCQQTEAGQDYLQVKKQGLVEVVW